MRAIATLPLALTLLLGSPASAQLALPEPARIQPTVIAPNATSFTLDNGLQVVVIPDRRLSVVTHMIWYRVGSADEARGESGIAHFLEHLMFKGTERFPGNSFSRQLSLAGGQENAFTSWDYTAYFQRTVASQLPLLMEFEADRMTNLVLTDQVVLPERDVILEERRQVVDNNPSAQFAEQVGTLLYQHHPYRIPIIGWEHEMRTLTRETALAFYARFYTPNNAVVVIAGDVDPAEVRRIADRTYGRVARRAPTFERARPSEPPARAPRRLAMLDPRVQQPSWSRTYLAPSYGQTRDGTAEALEVLSEILGSQTGRLFRRLVVERSLASSAGVNYTGSALDYGRFSFSATPRPTATFEQVEAAVDEVIAEVVRDGVTQDEVDKAINSMLGGAIFAQDSMGYIARYVGFGLMTGQSLAELQRWPERMTRVTVDQVVAAARRVLDIRSSVTGTLARGEPQRRS